MKPPLINSFILIPLLSGIFVTSSMGCDICEHDRLSTDAAVSKCKAPRPPQPGFISCTNTHSSMNCVGTCMAGFLFPNGNTKMILECNPNNGLWQPQGTFPNCIEEDLINVPERYREPEQYRQREEDSDERVHRRDEDRETEQHQRREDSGDSISRTLVRCRKPSSPANGYFSCQYDNVHMRCEGRCNNGYFFPGGGQEMQLECKTETGRWYPYATFPNCKRDGERYQEPHGTNEQEAAVLQNCQKPSPPAGGRLSCRYDSTQMMCVATCLPGYVFPESKEEIQLQCRADTGYWRPYRNPPDCVRDGNRPRDPYAEELNRNHGDRQREDIQKCHAPEAPENGYFSCKYNVTEMVCLGTCNSGYLFAGRRQEMRLHCVIETGYWYPYKTFPNCERVGDRYDDRNTDQQQRPESDDRRFIETLTKCRKPDSPFPGRLTCDYDTEGMKCVGVCSEGYYFSGGNTEMTLQCSTREGVWYPVSEFPQCHSTGIHTCHDCREHQGSNPELTVTLQRCRKLDPPIPGNIQCQYDTVGMNCTGTCKQGYYFPDYTTEKITRCSTNSGTWYPITTFPECTKYGDRLTGGQTGSHQRPNTDDNQLAETLARCRKPEPPFSGRMSCNYDTRGMTCKGTCYDRYHFPSGENEVILQCSTAEARWYPRDQFPRCQPIGGRYTGDDQRNNHQRPNTNDNRLVETLARCQKPEAPFSGRVTCSYDSRGMRCVGECYEGYYFPDGKVEMVIQCLTNEGVWYPTSLFPQCRSPGTHTCDQCTENEVRGNTELKVTLQRCRRPGPPIPGRVHCQYDSIGMNCTGRCKEGYHFPDYTREKIVQCLTNSGTWYPVAKYPECIRSDEPVTGYTVEPPEDSSLTDTMNRCRRPDSPRPGRVSCSYDAEGMKCVGTCSEGYYFPGGSAEMILHCSTRQAVWYPVSQFPQCITSGIQTCHECAEYEARDNADLQATLRRCRRPAPPVPGNVQCYYDSVGMNCTGTCNDGYYFPDRTTTKNVRCLTNIGTWYPVSTFPACIGEPQRQDYSDLSVTLNRCRRPPSPVPGQVVCMYDYQGMNCSGTCKDGYYFPDGSRQKTTQCITTSGTWYPFESYPDCVRYRQGGGYLEGREPHVPDAGLQETLARCKVPSSPAPGRISCTYNSTGITCTGTCFHGYLFPGRSNRMILNCLTRRGAWYPYDRFPQCEAPDGGVYEDRQQPYNDVTVTLARCKTPTSPVPGEVSCEYDSRGINCTGRCDEGYKFKDGEREIIVRCLAVNSVWYPSQMYPECVPATHYNGIDLETRAMERQKEEQQLRATLTYCRRPIGSPLVSLVCSHDTVGMNCTGRCIPGYYFPDGTNTKYLTCITSQGYWTPERTFPECKVARPGEHREEDRTSEDDNAVTLSRCRRPSSPSPGRISCSYNAEGMSCYGTCSLGYYFLGGSAEMVLNCSTREGHWRPYSEFPPCLPKDEPCLDCHQPQDRSDLTATLNRCKRPASPIAGDVNCIYDYLGMNCTGTCKQGYYFPDGTRQKNTQCIGATGGWRPIASFPDCIKYGQRTGSIEGREPHTQDPALAATLARCPVLSSPVPGRISCSYNATGMSCTGICSHGYLFLGRSDRMTLNCVTRQRIWYPYDKFPQCEAPGTGIYEGTDTQRPTTGDPGLTVILARCKPPSSPVPGEASCEYDSSGMNCTGTCKSGYQFKSGERSPIVIRCSVRNGIWYPSQNYPQCVETTYYDQIETERIALERQREEQLLRATLTYCRRPVASSLGYLSCTHNTYGMNCTGYCSTGYYFPDGTREKHLSCITSNGYWTPEPTFPDCRAALRPGELTEGDRQTGGDPAVTLARCRQPSSPSPGRVACSHDGSEMSCFGTCSLGYYFPGGSAEMVLKCSARDGIWRPYSRFPPCESKDEQPCQSCHQQEDHWDLSVTMSRCRRPSSPIPGRVHCEYDYRGMNCTGTCKEGYHFPDGTRQKITQCLTTNGIWYPIQSYPDCIKYGQPGGYREEHDRNAGSLTETLARCKVPSSPVPGRISCSYNSTGMTCTGICSHGYLFPGRSNRMVLECLTRQSVWYPDEKFPPCEAPDNLVHHGTQYSQRPSGGNVEFPVILARCKPPSSPVPGDVSCEYDSRGMNCTGKCKEGYQFRNGEREIIMRCLVTNGAWYQSQKYPDCIRATHYDRVELERIALEKQREEELLSATLTYCRRPISHSLGHLSCSHDTIGMNCTGQCRAGHSFPDGTRIKFLSCITSQGYWTPESTFPECTEEQSIVTQCKTPIAPRNGLSYCQRDSIQMRCTGKCNPGYYYLDGSTEKVLRCFIVNGTWIPQHIFPSCFTPREPEPTSFHTPLPVRIEEDTSQRTLRNCKRPEKPQNGYVVCKQSSVEMSCTGYCRLRHNYPDGSTKKVLHCDGETGIWSPSSVFPECINSESRVDGTGGEENKDEEEHLLQITLSKCRRPPSPSPGNVTCNYDRNGMNCTGICAPGYRFTDGRRNIMLTCRTERGSWYPLQIFPTCVVEDSRARCKKPAAPTNGNVACYNDTKGMSCKGRCLIGYRYPNGKRSMDTRCSFVDGIWIPFEKFPDCLSTDATGEGDNQQVLDKIREGNDKVEGTPRPHQPNEEFTTGPSSDNNQGGGINSEYNAELDRLCPRPPTPKGGYIDCSTTSNMRKCTGTCMSGYVFPNGRYYAILRCSLVGSWTPSRTFPDCIPTGSVGQGDNDATTDQGTSDHRVGLCRRPPSPKSGYIYCVYNSNIMECTGKCGPGYKFSTGETSIVHTCDQRTNRWNPNEAFPDCKPICDSPCYNGGICVRPNQCFCTQEYRGNYCQHPLSNCDPRQLKFAGSIRCNHTMAETVCELGCPQGTILDYPSYRIARCSLEGTWTPRNPPRCIEDPSSSQINSECGSSTCSSGITEGLCQRPSTPRPGTIRCIYNTLMMECTGRCAEGYKFTDGRRENIRTCNKKTGVWSPVRNFPECKPICERGCQNGSECLAPNTCICPMRFRGDQCQFSFSNCDPHQLRFAGSIRCNHTTTETICQLGCPAGTVLDQPNHDMIRCSLEGVWSPSVLPHCIEDVTYEKRMLASHHQTEMRYEQQYQETEISRTEAEQDEEEVKHEKLVTELNDGQTEDTYARGRQIDYTRSPEAGGNTLTETLRRCRRPDSPRPGRVTCNYDTERMKCVGTCSEGYYFPGGDPEMILQCSTRSANWYPASQFPQCITSGTQTCKECTEYEATDNADLTVTLRRCKRPNPPTPGNVQCYYDSTGMNCTGTCKEGYHFSDFTATKTVRCLTNIGSWYPFNTYPECIKYGDPPCQDCQDHIDHSDLSGTLNRCRRPSAPIPGQVHCTYDYLGMNCTASCKEGYYFPDGSRQKVTRCEVTTATWYPIASYPDCIKYGERTGYVGSQEPHKQDASLEETLARCKVPSPPVPGRISCSYNSTGMTCRGSCSHGYLFPSSSRRMILNCLTRRGIWVPFDKFPSCKSQGSGTYEGADIRRPSSQDVAFIVSRCKPPASPVPGGVSCEYDSKGMNCTGICKRGYQFKDGEQEITVRCLSVNGFWYPLQNYPECVKTSYYDKTEIERMALERQREEQLLTATLTYCRRPAASSLGYLICSHDTVGMNCTGSCGAGSYFPDGTSTKHLSCVRNQGFWTPEPKFPECSGEISAEGYDEGEEYMKGDARVTLTRCPRPDSPSPGRVSCHYDGEGMSCSGTCSLGYYFPGGSTSMVLNCSTREGYWRPYSKFPPCELEEEPPCEDCNKDIWNISGTLKKCKRPSSPVLGRVHCMYDYLGMNCSATCKEGYYFPDGTRLKSSQCEALSGSWYPMASFPDCVKYGQRHGYIEGQELHKKDGSLAETLASCKVPLSPVPGRISCTYNATGMRCTGTCSHGYSFPGRNKRMVLDCVTRQGKWYPYKQFLPCEAPGTGIYEGTDIQRPPADVTVILAKCKSLSSPVPGEVSCEYDSTGMNCTGRCKEGYQFKDGEREIFSRCSARNGYWYPLQKYPECVETSYYDKIDLETIAFERKREEELLRATLANCRTPIAPSLGYLICSHNTLGMNCTGSCRAGNYFPDGSSAKYLSCVTQQGFWTPEPTFPECNDKPSTKKRWNPNILDKYQQGSDNDEGLEREDATDSTVDQDVAENTRGYCQRPHTPKSGYIYCVYNANIMECTGKCGPGYKFPTGETTIIHTCDQRTNRWDPNEAFPDCKPICDSPCYNGGVCVRPNQCFCPQEYRGDYCQHPLSNCDPRQMKFAGSMRCNHTLEETICELGCPQGTILDYPSYSIARCSLEGTWTPRYPPRCIEDPNSSQENTDCEGSSCSSGITEGLCQRPATPRPGTIRCVYNNIMMECTGKCAEGYKFADGRRENIRTCNKETGVWSPQHSFPECKPICERRCQNGGECLAPNTCICPMRFRGDQCQYSFSNCDPHQLKFAGSIRCNHTTKETVCQLGCPAGTVLNRPEYMVRCSLEGVWSPSVLPRCVEDTTYEERLLASNHQSGMRYEKQYRLSSISHTEAEGLQERTSGRKILHRDTETHERPYRQRLSRIEQEDREHYENQNRRLNGGSVSHERDEFSTSEGRFRLYDDFLQSSTGMEGFGFHQGHEHKHSSTHKSKETQELRHRYFRQKIQKEKMEQFSHQHSHFRKKHEQGGSDFCMFC